MRPQNLCWLCPKQGSYFDIYQYFNVAEEIGHLLSIVIYPQFEYTTCISATRSATLSRQYCESGVLVCKQFYASEISRPQKLLLRLQINLH